MSLAPALALPPIEKQHRQKAFNTADPRSLCLFPFRLSWPFENLKLTGPEKGNRKRESNHEIT